MLSRKMKILLAIVMVILMLTAGVLGYVSKVRPLQTKMATLETSIKTEQSLIGKYENGDVNKTREEKDTLNLQKKIPVVDGVDQFIVMLEEAEVASGSLIREISLSKTTDAPKENNADTANAELGLTSQTADTSKTNENKAEPGTPVGLEKLTADLTVEAEDYFQLEAFVKKIEQFERITNVEQLQFSGFAEATHVESLPKGREMLSYQLKVSTYYFPKLLADLKGQAPKYDPAAPAEKKNPLYQSEIPDQSINGSSPDTKNYKVVEKNGVTYHVYSYDVKSGDTLFQLSVKYYNSRKGEAIIKSWNQIKQLEAGTTIEIPVPATA